VSLKLRLKTLLSYIILFDYQNNSNQTCRSFFEFSLKNVSENDFNCYYFSGQMTEKAFEFQIGLVEAKGIACFMGMLTRNDFLSLADLPTQQVLKDCQLVGIVSC